ncbi:MAG: S-layer homology domain-containing protein [Clostridia bacterium]|nr:S-layer homology domain-containing protein [Clostridia bacterium]
MTKKLLAVIAALLMIFGIMAAPVSAAMGELIVNGDFEKENTGWELPAGASYVGEDEAYEGKGAMKLEGEGNVTMGQVIYLEGGQTYNISFMAKAEGTAKAVLKLEYYTGNGGKVFHSAVDFGIDANGTWQQANWNPRVPEEVVRANFLVRLIGGGTLYYDNVSVLGIIGDPNAQPKETEKKFDIPKNPNPSIADKPSKAATDDASAIVINGGFENGTDGWGKEVEGYAYVDDEKYSGERSVRLASQDNIFISQSVYLVGGETYDISFMAKSSTGANAVIKFEFYTVSGYLSAIDKGWTVGTDWQKYTWQLPVPDGVVKANFLVRLIGGGILHYDDVKIEGKLSDAIKTREADREVQRKIAEEAEANRLKELADHSPKPALGEANIFSSDGTFETLDANGNPVNVDAYGEWGGQYVTLTSEEAHSGKYSAKIETTGEGGNPWIRFAAYDIKGGATYQLSFWYKGEIRANSGFQAKFEGYTENHARVDNSTLTAHTMAYTTERDWVHVTYSIKVPRTTMMLWIYPRMYSPNGTAYVDDVSLYMIEAPSKFEFNMDTEFFYPEVESGTVRAEITEHFEDIGYTMNYTILDGETVLSRVEGIDFIDKKANAMFSSAYLTEKMKEYTMRIEIVKPDGTVEASKDIDIYRIDRPSMMTEDGNFIIDGELFYPSLVYHHYTTEQTQCETAVAQGLNVIQFTARATHAETIAAFDELHKHGMKAALVLYHNMKPAGHEFNIERNKELIGIIKDHPALFGYMMMDEPFVHDPEIAPDLKRGYKMVRELDSVHPCMTCESVPQMYPESSKYMDLVTIDPYPGSHASYATHVADRMADVTSVIERVGKPAMNITQVFTFGGSKPTELQAHSMMYQTLIGGGRYIGYYPWLPDNAKIDTRLDQGVFWPVISSFKTYEYDLALGYYGGDLYPTYNKNVDKSGNAPYWYESWTDGTNVYMLVLNRQENAAEHTLDISVVSDNGLVKLTDYNVEAVNPVMVPEGARIAEKYDGGFKATVKAGQAILYKLTPATAVDMSQLSLFGDIANYSWAADAINAMFAEGVVNAKGNGIYEPAVNITRGDFAMFLINALKLNKDGKFDGNFADVDPNAEYAVEVAIGRKLGILKGVGDNMFNPETPITRQDLMVICARGMRIAKELAAADGTQLDIFSDKALIADYAVADMAAMVRDGIVKGNADGTVNPLGNTTRAEAAVIMSRIFNWNK